MLLFIFRICDLVNLPQIKTFLPISASKHISHRTLWKTLRRQKMAKALLGSFSAPLCLFLHVLFHLCPSRFSQRTSACKFLSSSLFNELFSLSPFLPFKTSLRTLLQNQRVKKEWLDGVSLKKYLLKVFYTLWTALLSFLHLTTAKIFVNWTTWA